EPMVAVFWSFLAVCLAALSFKTERKWPIIASGFLFVLAMATYRSTIFLAPAAIVIIWAGQARGHSQSFFHRAQVAVLCQSAPGCGGLCVSRHLCCARFSEMEPYTRLRPNVLHRRRRRFSVLDYSTSLVESAL